MYVLLFDNISCGNLHYRFGNILDKSIIFSANEISKGEKMHGNRLFFKEKLFFLLYKISGIIWIVYFLFASNLNAQNYNFRFESLTSDNGLSQNTVLSIFQDSRQFLWLGTYNGLNRYDGYNFKVYKMQKANPKSINGQMFTSIVEDKNGNLWIASYGGGLNKYDRLTDDFTRFTFDKNNFHTIPSDHVNTIFIDSKGRLWIGTDEGLCRYNSDNNFIRYDNILNSRKYVKSEYIISVCGDAAGNIWIGTWNGLIKLNPETNEYKYYFASSMNINSIESNFIGKVYLDKENNLWVGTSEGISKYDKQNDRFIRYDNPYTKDSKDKTIKDILEDSQGNLWIATYFNGLQKFDRPKHTFSNYTHNYLNKESISSNILFSLCEDQSGILWIGTKGSGVNKLNKAKSQFVHFQYDPLSKEGLSNNMVHSIVEDKSGVIWLGTFGGGLNRYDPYSKQNKFSKFTYNRGNPNSIVDDRIRTLIGDNENNIWIGTEYGLSMYDAKRNRFKNFIGPYNSALNNNMIFSLYQIKSGEIFIGTFGGGLNIYDKKKDAFTHFTRDPKDPRTISSNNIWCIYQDSEENIWIGTDDAGLNKFDMKNNEFLHYQNTPNNPNSISSNKVLTMLETKDGTLWLGTIQGINKVIPDSINKNKPKFINYTVKDGLPDNNIQSMIEDDHGNIWIGTNNGISKFNPRNVMFENYDVSDGLQSNEFFVGSCAKIKKTGELIFGGNKGFNIFHPDSIQEDITIPQVVLTDFKLFNSSVKIGEKIGDEVILKNNITETKRIILTYKQNIISFEFAALHFAAPEKNSYAYIMEGFDTDWNYVGNRNFANYTSIPPGEYTFRVKAANQNGVWNNNGIALKITIIPPFYFSNWFRILSVLLIVLVAFSAYKLKVKGIQKRGRELEKLISH